MRISVSVTVTAIVSLVSKRRFMTCLNPTAESLSAVGTKQITTGQITDGETVFAQLQAKINSYE